ADVRDAPDAVAGAHRLWCAARRHPDLDRRAIALGTDGGDGRARRRCTAARPRLDGIAVVADAGAVGPRPRAALTARRRRNRARVALRARAALTDAACTIP